MEWYYHYLWCNYMINFNVSYMHIQYTESQH